jgi:hypothetical protein
VQISFWCFFQFILWPLFWLLLFCWLNGIYSISLQTATAFHPFFLELNLIIADWHAIIDTFSGQPTELTPAFFFQFDGIELLQIATREKSIVRTIILL